MAHLTTADFRASVGGRWAVSVPAVALMSLAGLALVATNGPGTPLRWLIISACSTAALVLVFWLAHATVLRDRATHPVPVWVVVAVGMAAGLARALAVVGSTEAMGETLVRPWPGVIAVSVVAVAAGTVGLAALFDHLARQRARRAQLRVRLAALREQELDRSDLTDVITHAAYQAMITALDDARDGLSQPLGAETASDRRAVAANLRATVDNTLRPLSHTLYAASRRAAEQESAQRRGWTTWRTLPVRPLPTAIVIGVVAALAMASPLAALILAAAVWAMLAAVVQAGRRFTRVREWAFPLAAVFTGVVAGVMSVVVRGVAGTGGVGSGVSVGAVVGLPIMLAMVSAMAAVLQGEDAATERLLEQVNEREIDALVANRELVRATRALAEDVHGTTQSRLLAMAFAIDEAAAANDDTAFRDALARARLALEGAGRGETVPPGDVASALDDVALLWKGFIDVGVTVDPALPRVDAGVIEDISRVAGEGVANAHKHGEAITVDIVVAALPGGVRVTVTDDGVGPSRGVPGLGSAWLDFIAPGAWSLDARGGAPGAVLEVVLPVGDRSVAA